MNLILSFTLICFFMAQLSHETIFLRTVISMDTISYAAFNSEKNITCKIAYISEPSVINEITFELKHEKEVVNVTRYDNSIVYTIPKVSRKDIGFYRCAIYYDGRKVGSGSTNLKIGEVPLSVERRYFLCNSFNLRRIECEWPMVRNQRIIYQLYIKYSNQSHSHINHRPYELPCKRETNTNRCLLLIDKKFDFLIDNRFFQFYLNGTNDYGSNVQVFEFDYYKMIQLPSPIIGRPSMINLTSIKLHWFMEGDYPAKLKKDGLIEYKLEYSLVNSLFGPDSEPVQSIITMSDHIQLDNLLPVSMYSFKVYVRNTYSVKLVERWRVGPGKTIRTPRTNPTVVPEIISAFDTRLNMNGTRDFMFFWKDVNKDDVRGCSFRYVISLYCDESTERSTDEKNGPVDSNFYLHRYGETSLEILNVRPCERYQLHIYTSNQYGRSYQGSNLLFDSSKLNSDSIKSTIYSVYSDSHHTLHMTHLDEVEKYFIIYCQTSIDKWTCNEKPNFITVYSGDETIEMGDGIGIDTKFGLIPIFEDHENMTQFMRINHQDDLIKNENIDDIDCFIIKPNWDFNDFIKTCETLDEDKNKIGIAIKWSECTEAVDSGENDDRFKVFSIEEKADSEVDITWDYDCPALALIIEGFNLNYWKPGEGKTEIVSVQNISKSLKKYHIEDLSPSSSYVFQIQGYTSTGRKIYSKELKFKLARGWTTYLYSILGPLLALVFILMISLIAFKLWQREKRTLRKIETILPGITMPSKLVPAKIIAENIDNHSNRDDETDSYTYIEEVETTRKESSDFGEFKINSSEYENRDFKDHNNSIDSGVPSSVSFEEKINPPVDIIDKGYVKLTLSDRDVQIDSIGSHKSRSQLIETLRSHPEESNYVKFDFINSPVETTSSLTEGDELKNVNVTNKSMNLSYVKFDFNN